MYQYSNFIVLIRGEMHPCIHYSAIMLCSVDLVQQLLHLILGFYNYMSKNEFVPLRVLNLQFPIMYVFTVLFI